MTAAVAVIRSSWRAWAAGALVVLCLLGGLRIGDAHADRARALPESVQASMGDRAYRVAGLRVLAVAADRAKDRAERRAARAALAVPHAGGAHPHRLLPTGMRFACVDRAAGECVVVKETGIRSIALVWPLARPRWASRVGLPPGTCDAARQSSVADLSACT